MINDARVLYPNATRVDGSRFRADGEAADQIGRDGALLLREIAEIGQSSRRRCGKDALLTSRCCVSGIAFRLADVDSDRRIPERPPLRLHS